MSDLLLYVDEDAGEHAVIQALRARNIDVLTTIEAIEWAVTISANLHSQQVLGV